MMIGGAFRSCWLVLTVSLTGVLAGDWSVQLPSSPICAVIGSSVILPCSYDYPQRSDKTNQPAQGGGEVVSEMWCLEDSRCITQRYVYHSDGIFPDPSYQNRVEYLGRPGTKNCSLRISDLRQSDSGAYVFYLITNHTTQKMPEQSGVQLLVAASSSAVTVSASPPSDIAEGGTLRLACCSPAASAQTQFRWFMSTNSSPRHSGQVWSMGNVTSEASGGYYCQVQTGDKEQMSATLHVDVQYSPRNTFMSVSPAEDSLDNLPSTLTCSSDANPPVHTYSWYRGAACYPGADESSFPVIKTHASLSERSQTFSSSNTTAEVAGLYCCVARNRHGSQSFSETVGDSIARCEGGGVPLLALIFGILLTVIVILAVAVACVIIRRRKSSGSHSYALAETNATSP